MWMMPLHLHVNQKSYYDDDILLITQRCSSTCESKICVQFVYDRRRYVAMADIRHGLAPCNTNNLVVYILFDLILYVPSTIFQL